MFWICNVLNSPLTMRMKGAKIQTGANISLYTVYHPFMLYIYIYTALYTSQTKLWTLVNVCICWQPILSNMWPFGMSFIHEWTSFFFGGGVWLGEWVLGMRMSVYSFKSLIAICHDMFVNCDAINVLGYQFSLIGKKLLAVLN